MEVQPTSSNRAQTWTNLFRRVRWIVVLGFPLSVGVLIILAGKIQNKNDIELWLGDQDQAVQEYQQFRTDFGVGDSVLIAFEDCAADDPRLEQAARQIERLGIVLRCSTPQRLVAAGQQSGSPNIASRMTEVAPLVGSHSRFSAMLVELKPSDNLNRQQLLEVLSDLTRAAGFDDASTHWGGAPVINVALDRWAEETMKRYLPVVGLLGMICLWWSIRNIWIILCVLFSGGYSVLATLALMAATETSMNLIVISLPPMIFVLSLSFSIHLIHRWKTATDVASATGAAVLHTFRPTMLAACTTAIGSLSLATSQFEPVRNFGIWGAVGTLISFAVTYLWLPSNLAIEPLPTKQRQTGAVAAFINRFPPRATVALWPLLMILAVVGLLQLRAETDGLQMLPRDCRTIDDYRLIERRLTGQLPVEVIVHQPNDTTLAERVHSVRQVASNIRKNRYVEGVSDFTAIYPPQVNQAAAAMQRAGEQSNAFLGQISNDGKNWRLIVYVASRNGGELGHIIDGIKADAAEQSDVIATGLVPLIVAAQGEIFRSLAVSLVVAAGVLLVVLWVSFGSIDAAVLIVLLNITPVAFVFGLLGWLGHPINMATLTTASIALGVALDDTMHLLENYRFERRARPNQSIDKVVQDTLKLSIPPMIQTSLIAGTGMAVLGLSSFVPIAEFGGMIAVLLAFALLGDTILLPAVLRTRVGGCPAVSGRTNEAGVAVGDPESGLLVDYCRPGRASGTAPRADPAFAAR